MSAPTSEARHTATPDEDPCSVSSGTTMVDRAESLHLYCSRQQYEVATSRTLGSLARLETNLPPAPVSMSPTSSPSSPKALVRRAEVLLSPHSSKSPTMLEEGIAEKTSSELLRLGYHTLWSEQLVDDFDGEVESAEISIVSDDPPQLAPLRSALRFFPDLTVMVSDNDIAGELTVEHDSIKTRKEADGEQSSDIGFVVTPLCLRWSAMTSVWKDESAIGETSFYTAGETSFYYAPATKDDDAFITSGGTSLIQRPMTSFTTRLQDCMHPGLSKKSPSIASTSASLLGYTSSLSPKLQHRAVDLSRGTQPSVLRAQLSKAEPASNILTKSIPKMLQLDRDVPKHDLRVKSSLEEGLHAETLEVLEENVMAEAAEIVLVEADIVEIRRSEALEQLRSRDLDVSDRQHDRDMEVAPLNVMSEVRSVCSPSNIEPEYDVATVPIEILHIIVLSAAFGDARCTDLATKLYKALTEARSSITGCKWGARKQRLLLKSHLLKELEILAQYGFMSAEVFAVSQGQVFPKATTQMMSNRDFMNYIRRAVKAYKLAEERAEEILGLAIDDEDQGFVQTSPEDEVFFQREHFNAQGFVYDASSSDEHYERLRSLPSPAGTYRPRDQVPEPEPQPELRWHWRSSFFWKIVQVLRVGYRKPIA